MRLIREVIIIISQIIRREEINLEKSINLVTKIEILTFSLAK